MDLIIGDETVPGYSPKNLNSRFESKPLGKALGNKVEADAVKGASLTLSGKGNLLHQLRQFSLPAYQHVFLFVGGNDYLHSKAPIDKVAQSLNNALAYIRKTYNYVLVYGILPLPMYDQKGHSDVKKRGQAFYTLQDLYNMLGLVYGQCNVPVLNWLTLLDPVISKANYQTRLVDGRYPTTKTASLMADRISQFVKQRPNG